MNRILTLLGTAAVSLSLVGAPLAAPTLRSDITVADPVVTVGDMFADAGALAGKPLFRAPAPGTAGTVGLEAVHEAAARAGLTDYDAANVLEVRVARAATSVDAIMLADLIGAELDRRGLLGPGVEPETHFDRPDLSFNAEVSDRPAKLIELRYLPGSGSFAARFAIAGIERPVEVTGGIELMTEVPRLAQSLPAGAVLGPADIEMARVPLKFVSTTGIAGLDDLVGKALLRNARAGLTLKLSDVAEPLVITRNALVTVYLRTGWMTLTVKAQALASASAGAPIDVLNTVTHRILHGTATAGGAVEVTTAGPFPVAGL
jgi:flagella basal body P-ring formation protein FlgA